MMEKLHPIMLAGTGSDVGKSLIAAGLCRVFLQDGYHPAPFKAQNMALNSFATPDGLEIGRAQAVQAEAAGLEPSTDMNPILLKPSSDHTSQVVVNGKPIGNRDSYDYFRKEGKEELRKEAHNAFDRLAQKYNPIVMEGAGSISEINLRESDIVNMSMARYAGARVLLVADIDRGGVFASAYGSVMLQPEEDRKLIKGIIINKFRGDMRLFDEGKKMMEEICGIPVIGVLPFLEDVHIEEEDSVALAYKNKISQQGKVNIGVVILPHISNYTDFNVLERHPGINLFYASAPSDLDKADIIILPGSKSTIADLAEIRSNGMAEAILKGEKAGKRIIGICGGYQMLGLTVEDPENIEGNGKTMPGLGLLPVHTVITDEKKTVQTRFRLPGDDRMCEGYEIHMGVTTPDGECQPFCVTVEGMEEGCSVDSGRIIGTYIHGFLDNQAVIERLLSSTGLTFDIGFDYHLFKEQQYNLLADKLRDCLDIEAIYKIMQDD